MFENKTLLTIKNDLFLKIHFLKEQFVQQDC
jgi:hypothetical protein